MGYNMDGVWGNWGGEYDYDTLAEAALAKAQQAALISQTTYGQSAGTIVTERMDILNAYAADAYALVKAKVNEITSFVSNLTPPDASSIDTGTVTVTPLSYGARPVLGSAVIPTVWPTNDTTPLSLLSLPAYTLPTLPALSVTAPSFVAPAAPTLSTSTEPVMTGLVAVDVPTAPSVTLPAVPTFTAITLPSTPSITLPAFSAVAPSLSIDAPGAFTWGEPAYNSDIYTDILAKVLSDIRNGGTGLDATVEADLYQRHLDRTFAENEKMYHETENYFAARGFTLPPGALAGALNEVSQQISRNNIAASRDITISQAELAQKNQQFIMELGVKLEGMIREFYTQNTNRVMEAAKITADNALAIYESKVKLVTLALESYKTEATIYEARVKGALTQVEIFKGQIEGAKVSAEVQKGLVDVYQAQVGACEMLMKLYVSEMEGAKIATELEMTKVERYKTETQVYVAKQEIEKNKIALYEAVLKGETVKAETYKTQVSTYGIEVEAYGKQIDAAAKAYEVILSSNRNEVERYKAELSAYETEVRAKASEIGAIVSGFQAETAAYQAESGAQESYYRVKIEEIRANILAAEFNMKQSMAEVEATIRGYEAVKTLQLKGAEGMMNVGAQLTASALNAVNASASIGFSDSRSDSTSVSQSTNESTSTSESNSFSDVHSSSDSTSYNTNVSL